MKKRYPYRVLEIADMDRWPEAFDPYEEAIESFEPKDLDALASVLRSSDHIVSRRGLHLFGRLGLRAYPIIDDALKLSGHPDVMARNDLLDGLLCYSAKLSASQVRPILLIEDMLCATEGPGEVVRGKVVALIGALNPKVVIAAIEGILDEEQRLQHLHAFKKAAKKIDNVQHVFDKALRSSGLEVVYLLAAIIRSARQGLVDIVPTYSGGDFVCSTVISNIRRIIGQNLRRNDLEAWCNRVLRKRSSSKKSQNK